MRIKESSQGKHLSKRSAFTLAEVVMAVFVVALVFGGVLTGYVQATKRAEWSGYSLAAQAAAIQQIEQARAANWDPSKNQNEITNLNLSGMAYYPGDKAWKGYFSTILDLPISGNTNGATRATNFVSISMLTNVAGASGVALELVKIDTVWVFYAWGGKKLYTNTVATYLAPDSRDPNNL
jgi:type II secretory pathway pseudopilin PulG